MKIFGFLDNYARGCDARVIAESIGKDVSSCNAHEPRMLLFSDSSLLTGNKPFFVPDDGHQYRAYPSVAIRIDRLGKSVASKFAHRYFSEATFGFNIRDISRLEELRGSAMPWAEAVSFDGSAPIGNFRSADELLKDYVEIEIRSTDRLGNAGDVAGVYSPKNLLRSACDVLEIASRRNTIKNGDIIFVGFSNEGFDLHPGMNIECSACDWNLLTLKIR